jgi:hypothetical protein
MADDLFDIMKAANDLDYILGGGTDGSDTDLNSCNIVAGHAFSMIAVFELTTGETVDAKLYMMRNPWSMTDYNGDWNQNDEAWTEEYISQVPNGVDPTTSGDELGIFFVDHVDFLTCFQDYQVGHYRNEEGYSSTWYDVEDNDASERVFEITVPAQSGDLYFSAETYYQGTIPANCQWGSAAPYVIVKLDLNSENLYEEEYMEDWYMPF